MPSDTTAGPTPIDATLATEPLDPAAAIEAVRARTAGAVVTFLGTVREITGDERTLELTYEAYAPMAAAEMRRLGEEAAGRWPLAAVVLSHRTGTLGPGEAAVVVAVSAGHRDEAFAAARWLIDSLKERVPIWKKESFADGRREWVRPEATA